MAENTGTIVLIVILTVLALCFVISAWVANRYRKQKLYYQRYCKCDCSNANIPLPGLF